MGDRCQAKKTHAARRFMVRSGISPFSAYPRCDVCNRLRGPLRQVGRWMIHAACYDDELVTLRLPRLVYPAARVYRNGRHEDAMVMLHTMAAKLEGYARRQLRDFRPDDLLELLKVSQMPEWAPPDPPQFGPSGRPIDARRSDQIRRQGQELIRGEYTT